MTKMTIEESRLEDLAKKAAHIQRTGYDYSKEVQGQIQKFVEIEMERSLQNPRSKTFKHLIPTPGLYDNNILIKKEDIYAYKESHPHVASPLSKRRAIIDALKLGSSVINEKRVVSAPPEEKETIKVRILNTQNQEVNKYSFMSRGEYREWFTDLLPYVVSNSKSTNSSADYDIVVNDQYLTREVATSPKTTEKSVSLKLIVSSNVYPPISENSTHKTINNTLARASLKKSSTIGELARGTEITLISDYFHDGTWAIAKSDSHSSYGNFFILKSDIKILDSVSEHPKRLDLEKSIPKPEALSIDWTTQRVGVPYYDTTDAKHKVSIETSFEKMDSISSILIEGFNKGAKLILENLGKSTDESALASILDNEYYEKAVRATDIYVSDRKGSGILVLVEAPHRYVSTFPPEVRKKSVYYCEDYDSSSLLNQINQVASKIDSIQNDIENYDGDVLNFDTKREKDNLLLIISTIRELFSKNGFNGDILKSNGIIVMKWDSNFRMVGLEYESNDTNHKVVVTEGLLEEVSKEHMESQRVQQIIYTLYEIVSEGLQKPWTQFLEDYVSFDTVELISKQSKLLSQLDEKEAGPVKTLEEYNKEQNFYANLDRKAEVAAKRELESDFAGSSLLDESTINNLKDNIASDAKDTYDKFLNNIDFRKIVLQSVKSLIPEKINEEMDNILNEAEKIEQDINNYKARLENGVAKARQVKDEAINTVEQVLGDLKNASEYFPRIDRDFEIQIQGMENADFNVAGSISFSLGDTQDLQEVQAYMNQIKNIEAPVFETMSNFLGTDNPIDEASEMLTQASAFSTAPETISESIKAKFENTSGLDNQTNNLLKEEALNLVKGSSVDFKKVTHFPQMKYDDNLPTDDISEVFFNNLMNSMSSMLNERIKHLVKSALDAAAEAIFSNGAQNSRIGNSPGDTFENQDVSIDKEEVKPLVEKMFGTGVNSDDIQNALDDVGNLLSPREFCELLNGSPSDVTLNISKSILTATHPQMHLNTSSKIRDFFLSISRFSNYSGCDEISKEVPEYITDDYLCPPNPSLREGILKNKGMSDSQIKEQLERERDRSRKLAEDLLDQLKNGLLSADSKAPNNFCSKTADGKVIPGQSSFMDENLRYTLQSTIIKTFEPIYSFFKTDSDIFAESLFSNGGEEGRVPLAHVQKLVTTSGLVQYAVDSRAIDISLPIEEKLPTVSSSEATEEQPSAEEQQQALQALQGLTGTEPNSRVRILEEFVNPGEIQNIIYPSTLPTAPRIFLNQSMPQSYLDYINLGPGESSSSIGFLQKILVNSFSNNTNITEAQVRILKSSSQTIQNKLRSKFFSNIFSDLRNSPYLKEIGKVDPNTKSSEYVLDYINICPPPNDSCDPHLLNVRGEVDKIYNSFKEDMCVSPNAASEETNPLEGSLMSSCVSLTLRHYLVETLLKGITSLSVTQGKDKIDEPILRYILHKMRTSMKEYSNEYYSDFKKFAKESYKGNRIGEDIFLDMLQQEYNKVSRLLFEVLFLGGKVGNYKQKVISSIPTVSLVMNESKGLLVPISENFVNDKSPLIIVKSNESEYHLCLAIEQPSGMDVTPNEKVRDFYKKSIFGDLVPIAVDSKPENLLNSLELKILLDVCFPIDVFSSAILIHEIETASRINDIDMAFGNTRDSLFSIFYSIKPEIDDWKKENPLMKELGETSGMGGGPSLTALWDFNFGVFDTPVTKNTFNFGLPLPWGSSFKGLFFSYAQKAIKDAAMKTFKDSVETSDPNIIISKKLSLASKLAGKNVSTTEISALMYLINPFMFPPTPANIAYNALGLGSYLKRKIDTNSPEGAEKASKIFNEETGLKMPQLCEEILLD